MIKRKIKKIVLISVLVGVSVTSGVVYYLFNMPHRDVQSEQTDYRLSASDLVNEYLTNAVSSNKKYLSGEGESKILAVTGVIQSVSTDQNNQVVVLLKDSMVKAGVSCTFTEATNQNAASLTPGQTVTIKGVIRSGAGYDEDLQFYEDVIMEKCDLIN